MWVLFYVPCPTPSAQTARDLYEKCVTGISEGMPASARKHGCRFHRAWYAEDGSRLYALAFSETREGARAFYERWRITDEPSEAAIRLTCGVELVPLP